MFKKLLKFGFLTGLAGALFGSASLVGMYSYFSYDLPDVSKLRSIELSQPLRIYDTNGILLADYGHERRLPLEFNEFPTNLVNAIVAVEDRRYFEHHGIDPHGIARALYVLLTTGHLKQGASTITQQVARNFFLSHKKEITRKVKEIILSLKMEKELSKDEILALYMNKIYLGNRTYGFAAAANTYFSKTVDGLTLSEAALLAGIQQSPTYLNPIANLKRSVARRDIVLAAMYDTGKITLEQYQEAKAEQIVVKPAHDKKSTGYVSELARQTLFNNYGEWIYNSGYKVYTTVDVSTQEAARKAVRRNLTAYDRRHGWRNVQTKAFTGATPSKSALQKILKDALSFDPIFPMIVMEASEKEAQVINEEGQIITLTLKNVEWAKPFIDRDTVGDAPTKVNQVISKGDLIYVEKDTDSKGKTFWNLAQIPEVNSGLASIDVRTGAIQALVGGWSYNISVFNRGSQAAVQVGSTIKPFIYAKALEDGFSWAFVVNDDRTAIKLPDGKIWRPINYGHSYIGDITLRQGMAQSRNTVVVKLSRELGVQNVANFINRFGFDPNSYEVTNSMVLGSINFTPLEMARAYAAFDNGGFLVDPYLIRRIEDADGQVIYEANPKVACPECSDIPNRYYSNKVDFENSRTDIVNIDIDKSKDKNAEVDAKGLDSANKREKVDDTLSLVENSKNKKDNEVVYAPRILGPDVAFLIRDGLRSNIWGTTKYGGTGAKAKVLGRQDIGGKTGTTNDSRAAWFTGYAGPYATSLFVAFDNYSEMGAKESGGKTALQAWIEFEKYQLQFVPQPYQMTVPPSLVKAKINTKTGLLDDEGIDEYFIRGTEPTKYTPVIEETPEDSPISNGDLNDGLF